LNTKKFLLRSLLIRDHEWNLVKRLFAFEFFQGVAIALFFYTSISLFLLKLPPVELAYAFILSAFFLWAAGAFYAWLEHRVKMKQLMLIVVFFNLALVLLFRFGLYFKEPPWFYYVMLAAFNVAYLMNNLEFWGSAAMVFDVRQSKRLFAIISAGDIPAKLIGYLFSAFLAGILGKENLLWFACASLLVSLLFYKKLIHAHGIDLDRSHDHQHANPLVKNVRDTLRSDALIRQAALISFFSFSAFVLLTFLFFGYVKEAANEQSQSLGLYIAIFLAASRGVTLIFKLVITNRLADNLGLRNSLLITPVILALLCLLAFPASLNNSVSVVFFSFATITIIIDVLRAAIQSPVLLAAMQPLPEKQRLAGHTIIKGITDPFAFFIVGVLLATSMNFNQGQINFLLMTAVLFLLILGWIFSILRFGKIYRHTLQQAIRNRSISEREISVTDRESLTILLSKIQKGEPGEAILALELIRHQPAEVQEEFLNSALHHESAYVKSSALSMALEWKNTGLLETVKKIARETSNAEILFQSVSVLAALDPAFDFEGGLHHASDEVVMATVLDSILKNHSSAPQARKRLLEWVSSSNPHHRKHAAVVAGSLRDAHFFPSLIQLMRDADLNVQRAAIKAIGELKEEALAKELLPMIRERRVQKLVIDSLIKSGDASIAAITQMIISTDDDLLREKLILLLGKIGSRQALHTLDHLTDDIPSYREWLFRALSNGNFKANELQRLKYEMHLRSYLSGAVRISFILHYLMENKNAETLVAAFGNELAELRDKMLQVMGFLYDQYSIKKAKTGFDWGSRESISNALEIVINTVAREYSKDFVTLFEPVSFEQRCQLLAADHPAPHLTMPGITDEVLRDQHHQYHPWTKSCVMYFMKDHIRPAEKTMLHSFRHSGNPLLSETAEWTLQNLSVGGH
jgi:HEAT repeat protein